MPESVFYMRGMPTALDIGDQFMASPEMLADLMAIAELSDEQAGAIHKQLKETPGFSGPDKTLAIIREVVTDASLTIAIHRAIQSLEPKDVEPLLAAVSKQADKPDEFEDATLDRLRDILPVLIDSYPSLVRFEKAEQLAKLTGESLESIELICDLRPIFDELREQVEGMMPYTRLRIVATGVDGLPRSFEAELTGQDVHDLAEKAKKAEVKLDALRHRVEAWLPEGIPDLPLTRPPKKEETDA